MKYKCVDRGKDRCPCALMEAGQCYTCTMSRTGECDCSTVWQGECPYNEFLQNGGKAVERGLPAEFSAVVAGVKEYSDQLAVVRLAVRPGFARRCSYVGSFITASALGCRVPLSVMRAVWSPCDNAERNRTESFQEKSAEDRFGYPEGCDIFREAFIEIAVQPAGPKTMELLKIARGDSADQGGADPSGEKLQDSEHPAVWNIAGPFEAGLIGAERLNFSQPVTVIAKGTAIAPFINLLNEVPDKSLLRLLVDGDKLTETFLDQYLEDIPRQSISLYAETERVLKEIDQAGQIMLLASPYYTEKFLEMRPGRKGDIIISNHANMCCGAGICGACSYTDGDGVTVRRCKCVV